MKRTFPPAFIAFGILLSMGVLGQLYLNNRVSSSTTLDLPNQLAGLGMTDSKGGDRAISEFTDLHGRSSPVISGVISIYGNREITLWVAGTASDSIAQELTDAMQKGIAGGNSLFTPIDEIKNRGGTIYALAGMGQKHYYFQSQNMVIWLAADLAVADEVLQQIPEVYS